MEAPMHGFGHIEIPSTNFKRTMKFFGGLFGWTFQDYPDMKYVVFVQGQPGGGFYLVKKMPKKGRSCVHRRESIDAKLKEIKARGKVLVKKTEFPAWDGCAVCHA
jgi:predicted enzyme related to lactoylglutathione lyase